MTRPYIEAGKYLSGILKKNGITSWQVARSFGDDTTSNVTAYRSGARRPRTAQWFDELQKYFPRITNEETGRLKESYGYVPSTEDLSIDRSVTREAEIFREMDPHLRDIIIKLSTRRVKTILSMGEELLYEQISENLGLSVLVVKDSIQKVLADIEKDYQTLKRFRFDIDDDINRRNFKKIVLDISFFLSIRSDKRLVTTEDFWEFILYVSEQMNKDRSHLDSVPDDLIPDDLIDGIT